MSVSMERHFWLGLFEAKAHQLKLTNRVSKPSPVGSSLAGANTAPLFFSSANFFSG